MDGESHFRFSLDSSLGRLARFLRLLGHDAAWIRGDTLGFALARARAEGRALLTRSGGPDRLEMTWPVAGGLVITASDRISQLAEVGTRWPIFSSADPFSRCPCCNEKLHQMDVELARSRVPPYVAATQDSFHICPVCTRIYWQGTHALEILRIFGEAAVRCGQQPPQAERKGGAGSEVSNPAPWKV